MSTALLLIAHGSRLDEANADLRHLAGLLRERGQFLIIEPCYLELAEPGIDDGAARCIEQGAVQVILVPYFLSPGVHVMRDLTAARERLAQRHVRIEFRLAEPLGRHPLLVDVVVERVARASVEA